MRLTSLGHAAVLIESGGERILVDPWLTGRLDRFWEHWPALPPGLVDTLDDVDGIVFSHHHYDHHHFPSLRALARSGAADFDETPSRAADIQCFWPRSAGLPRFTASGLGHQAIPWTLRRLGYTRFTGVRPGDTFQIGDTTIRSFVSRVPFPEMSLLVEGPDATVLLAGDSVLHPDTMDAFAAPDAPRVDVAFVPAHSLAPPGVLTERRPMTQPEEVRARAAANFSTHVQALNPAVTVPSSFGWRVTGEGDRFRWCNSAIFPFTPWQAMARLAEMGRDGMLWGPGQVMTVERGLAQLEQGPTVAAPYDFAAVYAETELNPAVQVPPFDPQHDRVGSQRDSTDRLAHRLVDELVGTDFWFQAAESGSRHLLRVTEDGGAQRVLALDPAAERVLTLVGPTTVPGRDGEGYTDIAGSTLQALFDGDLLFGSSYGLWTSDSNMLSAVFHHPRWYVQHVGKVLAGESPAAQNGRAA
jgi:L-ascorbate metabolism protein UlaG (beta-lactamase superfamily)